MEEQMKQENILGKIINKIRGLFIKQELIAEKSVEDLQSNSEPLASVKLSTLELEELQYELENGFITEEELDENQKQQLKDLYNTQIKELETDINYTKYEYGRKS